MKQVIEVKGMTCGHCVRSVTTELMKIPGIREVIVELQTGKVSVQSDAALDYQAVVTAIDEAGYELVG